MNSKLYTLEVRNGIYYTHGRTKAGVNTEFNSKLVCNLTEVCDIEVDLCSEVNHLPMINHIDPETVQKDNSIFLHNNSNNSEEESQSIHRVRLSLEQRPKRIAAGKLWHRRYAHAAKGAIYQNLKVTVGMDKILCDNDSLNYCGVCALAKFNRKPFQSEKKKSEKSWRNLTCRYCRTNQT